MAPRLSIGENLSDLHLHIEAGSNHYRVVLPRGTHTSAAAFVIAAAAEVKRSPIRAQLGRYARADLIANGSYIVPVLWLRGEDSSDDAVAFAFAAGLCAAVEELVARSVA